MHIHIHDGHPFAGVYARQQRGRELFQKLGVELQAYIEGRPFKLAGHIDPVTTDNLLVLSQIIPVPFACSFLLSELLHHWRSILDNLAFLLAAKNDPISTDLGNVYFPIVDRLDKLRVAKRRAELRRFFSDRDFRFIEAMRPAKDGVAWFWILHRLNIIDKHRFILRPSATTDGAPYSAVKAMGKDGNTIIESGFYPPPWVIGDVVIRSFANANDAKVVDFHPAVEMFLDVPELMKPVPLRSVIVPLAKFIDEIIKVFLYSAEMPQIDNIEVPEDWDNLAAHGIFLTP